MSISTRAKVWIYPSDKAAWHFVTLSAATAEKLRKGFTRPRRGFGSIPVVVTIGEHQWKTSVFPDATSGSFLLPIKLKVRKKESIKAGQTISFSLAIDRWR